MERINELESKLKELVETTNRDDFRQWLIHPLTKALLIRLELDEEVFKEEWMFGRFETPEQSAKAQGKAFYTKALAADIRTMKPAENENYYQEVGDAS